MPTKEKQVFELGDLDNDHELVVTTRFGNNVLMSVFSRVTSGITLQRYIFKEGEKKATAVLNLGFVLVSGLSESGISIPNLESDGILCTVILADDDKSASQDGKIIGIEIKNKGYSKSNFEVKPPEHRRTGKRGR